MEIDFVITWVDMDDPKWKEEFYTHSDKIDNSVNEKSEARFRDYGFLSSRNPPDGEDAGRDPDSSVAMERFMEHSQYSQIVTFQNLSKTVRLLLTGQKSQI